MDFRRLPSTVSAAVCRTWPSGAGTQSPPADPGGGDDDGVRGDGGSGDTYHIERVFLNGDQADGTPRPTRRPRRGLLARGVVGARPASKRRGQLRHTGDDEWRDDFAIHQTMVDR